MTTHQLPEITLFSPELYSSLQAMKTEAELSQELSQLGKPLSQKQRGSLEVIGRSEEGRPLWGAVLGTGSKKISLVSGAHSDEPIGAMTLTQLISDVALNAEPPPWLEGRTFYILPHINPDGASINESWIKNWADPEQCLKEVFRELPGRDVEFGYPDLRVENEVWVEFLKDRGPLDLHMSLHGMLISEGGLLLIERGWIDRTKDLQTRYGAVMKRELHRLFDHNRHGEKGFEYIGPGFTTTPRGTAMREHFLQQNDPQTAQLFKQSSMEWVQSLGGQPLCLVTEIPLFLLENLVAPPQEGLPTTYLDFKSRLPQLRIQLERGESVGATFKEFGLKEVPVNKAIALQLLALELGLQCIEDESCS